MRTTRSQPWQLASWEAYRDVVRLGRKTRLPEAQRKVLGENAVRFYNLTT